jgi:hypothetical protein
MLGVTHRDVGVVVQEDRQALVARVEQVGDVALQEAHGIADVADRQRRDHTGVSADLERELQGLERLCARRRRESDPGFDRKLAGAHQP